MMARIRLPLFWRQRLQAWREKNWDDSVKAYAQAHGVDLPGAAPRPRMTVREWILWSALVFAVIALAMAAKAVFHL